MNRKVVTGSGTARRKAKTDGEVRKVPSKHQGLRGRKYQQLLNTADALLQLLHTEAKLT